MVKQLAKSPANIPFCNEGSRGNNYLPNNASEGIDYEVDFTCDASDVANYACEESRVIERVAWLWAIAFAFSVPQIGGFLTSLFKWLFKFTSWPSLPKFLFVLVMEVLHTVGLSMICFMVLPHMDSVQSLLLTCSFAVLPSFLLFLSRFQANNNNRFLFFFRGLQEDDEKEGNKSFGLTNLWIFLDIAAVIAQVSGALIWCLFQYLEFHQEGSRNHPYAWSIPVAVILTSFGWWENFTDKDSWFSLGKFLYSVKEEMTEKKVVKKKIRTDQDQNRKRKSGLWKRISQLFEKIPDEDIEYVNRPHTRHRVYTMIIPIKLLTFYVSMFVISWWTNLIQNPSDLTNFFDRSFNTHTYKVTSVQLEEIPGNDIYQDGIFTRQSYFLDDEIRHPLWILLVQLTSSYLTYFAVEFASKVWIQSFSFAFPITLAYPTCIALLVTMCGARASDQCAFENSAFYIPNRLFLECPDNGDYFTYFWNSNGWIAIFWFLSFIWINIHIWFPKSPKLATPEQLFCTPWYEGLFIDQSLVMNRKADNEEKDKSSNTMDEDEDQIENEYIESHTENSSSKSSLKKSDHITRIYACATMWHEEKEEMMEMLKSIFRVDSDYSSRRLARKYLGVKDPDYYEWETHIFFDNVFEKFEDGKGGERRQKAEKDEDYYYLNGLGKI